MTEDEYNKNYADALMPIERLLVGSCGWTIHRDKWLRAFVRCPEGQDPGADVLCCRRWVALQRLYTLFPQARNHQEAMRLALKQGHATPEQLAAVGAGIGYF